jgi:hypothetical protein
MISYSVYFTWQIYICMPINITLPLEKTEGAIRNGQIRDTDNIRYTRDRTNNDRHYITQNNKNTIQMIIQVIRKRKQSLLN